MSLLPVGSSAAGENRVYLNGLPNAVQNHRFFQRNAHHQFWFLLFVRSTERLHADIDKE